MDDGIWRFEGFELDPATRELRHGGAPVALQPRVFDLLAYLIENRERAVDKDEIQDAVWTGMVVTETALTRAIMKARRAVGDSAERQAVIKTVHGHGYRFVAELEPSREPAADRHAAPAPDARTVGRLRWLLGGTVAALAVAVVWLLRPGGETDAGTRVAVLPVENASGDADLDWIRLGLMGLANDLLQGAAGLEIVAASDVVRFDEARRAAGPADGDSEVALLGALRRHYGATHALRSELTRAAGTLKLTFTLIGPDGLREQGHMVSGEGVDLVQGMVRSVAAILTDRRRWRADHPVLSDDPFLNEAYARGRSYALQGRCADALPLFAVVREADESLVPAALEWAKCAHVQGQWREAEDVLADVLERLGDDAGVLRAAVLDTQGMVYLRTGRPEQARAAWEAGLAAARETGDAAARAQLLTSMAILTKDARDFAAAREYLARATLAWREAGRDVVPGQVPAALANIAMGEGRLDRAHAHLATALDAFRTLGDRRNEAMMLNNAGYLLRLQGRYGEAEDYHRQSLAIRREIGDRVGEGRILGMLSTVYAADERFAEAADAAGEAVAIAREANDRLFLATGLAQLAAAQRGLGRIEAARGAWAESGEVFAEIGDTSREAQVQLRLAALDMDTERYADAASRIDAVLAKALANDLHEPAIEALDYRGDLERDRDRPAAAREAWRAALAHIEATGFTARKADIAVKLAHLHLDADDMASAEPLIGYALGERASAPALKLQARYAYLKGDAGRSVELMERARELDTNWSADDAQTLTDYRAASR